MKKLVFVGLILIAASCSPQKRLIHLLTKHPGLLKVDTIIRIDTFLRERLVIKPGDTTIVNNVDTVIETKTNTIYITRENVKIVTKADTIHVRDTIIKYKESIHDKLFPGQIEKQEDSNWTTPLLYFLIGAVAVFLAHLYSRK